jgi:hypothetical protein
MQAPHLMQNRRRVRLGLKVIHRHRAGDSTFRRVSELVFVRGKPRAVLGWIDAGGVRTPIYISELDPAKLRRAAATKNTYYYDEVTVDPRYEQTLPADALRGKH